jgi:hypothetical protein
MCQFVINIVSSCLFVQRSGDQQLSEDHQIGEAMFIPTFHGQAWESLGILLESDDSCTICHL